MPDIIIPGPSGRLEGRYYHSKQPDAPLALILHPDPARGGTMNNRITFELFQAFVARGFSTLRFNFRGVGKSQGTYDRGEGELSDAASALDWMQDLNKNAPYMWVAGFSFGAWIGMQLLMRRPEIRGFISASLPTNEYDFTFLAPCPSSGLIIHGGADTLVPRDSVDDMVDKVQLQKGMEIDYRVVSGANHFFHNSCDEMLINIHDHLNHAGGGNQMPVEMLMNREGVAA